MEFLEKLNIANKELRKELGREVKVLGRCKCCGTCTAAEIHNQDFEYYIAWKIFSSGMNKNIENYKNGKYTDAYAIWNLTDEQLEKAVKILKRYFTIEKPESEMQCIIIKL